MNSMHDPDPTFVSHLEWQVKTALRRRDRFARLDTPRLPRSLSTTMLVLFSVFLGAAGAVTSERIQDARTKELHLARARVEYDLSEARLESATAEYVRMRDLHQAGAATDEELATQEESLLSARIDRDRAVLDHDEIAEGGVPPRNDLAAPKVAGRDFVSQRLRLDLARAERAVATASRRLDRLNVLFANGMAAEREVHDQEGELVDAAHRREEIARRLELRATFLAGEIPAERVDALASLEQARSEMESARRHLVTAMEEAERAREAAATGLATEREQRDAELGVREWEARVRELEMQIEILSRNG